jgi:hypothetical protein
LRVFENRVLRRISGPKRDEVTGDWRKLHGEGPHNSYHSSNVIRVIKSRRMRWDGPVARAGRMRNTYKLSVTNPKGRDHLRDIDIYMGEYY